MDEPRERGRLAPVQLLGRHAGISSGQQHTDGDVEPEAVGRAVGGWVEREPDALQRLDVRRHPTQILTFSQGSHHCIGSAAARMMARVALEELLARIPSFTSASSGPSFSRAASSFVA